MKRLAMFLLLAAAPAFAQPVDPYGEDVPAGPADPYADAPVEPAPAPKASARALDLNAVQGMLAVQSLDGWLLHDHDGLSPSSRSLVGPTGTPTHPWFYWVPDEGEPTTISHQDDAASFAHLPGTKVTYAADKDAAAKVKAALKGKRKKLKGMAVAMDSLDKDTIGIVKGFGVSVKSSASLVQFNKAPWGPQGRIEHYVAVHHIVELRKDALEWLEQQIRDGKTVTELDVQARLVEGMAMRGIEGPAPVVAAGSHTSDPTFTPAAGRSSAIVKDDLVMISLAAKTAKTDGIYAAASWVAYVGDVVPERMASAFEVVSLARDEALNVIIDKVKRHRAIKGSEVDKAARAFVGKANLGDNFSHRTGHALDTDLEGAAAHLSATETRTLTVGTGFTIGPGVYFELGKATGSGGYGVRAEVSCYLGADGLEVTTPKQEQIEALLAK